MSAKPVAWIDRRDLADGEVVGAEFNMREYPVLLNAYVRRTANKGLPALRFDIPLYAESPAQARALAIQECARIGRDLYRGDGSRLSSCDEGYNEAVAEYRDAIRALSPAPSVTEEWVQQLATGESGIGYADRCMLVRATLAALGVEVKS
jgi:hypothetical protein